MADQEITRNESKKKLSYRVTDGLKTHLSSSLPEAVELTYQLNQENPRRPFFVMEGGLVVVPIPVDNNEAWFIRYGEAGKELAAIVRGINRQWATEFCQQLSASVATGVNEQELVVEVERYDPEKHQAEYLEKRYPLD